MGAEQHFSIRADGYDKRRAAVVPGFLSFYSTFEDFTEPGLTLDIGAGTGILSKRLEDKGHSVVLLDVSENMLHNAREKTFRNTVRADMRYLPFDPGFDNVVSALAIHHLEAGGKKALYDAVHDLLEPGGSFVHGDMVRAPTEELQEHYMELWYEYMASRGLEEKADRLLEDSKEMDIYEELCDQLKWLRDAGFENVDCYWKRNNFAVFGGTKPD